MTYKVRQELLQNWGFRCQCNLCIKNEEEQKHFDLLVIKRGDLMMKTYKLNDDRYQVIMKLIEMTKECLNRHPLYLFEHHLQALKCCVRSENQDLCDKIQYHSKQIYLHFSTSMGEAASLPYNAQCLLKQERVD